MVDGVAYEITDTLNCSIFVDLTEPQSCFFHSIEARFAVFQNAYL